MKVADVLTPELTQNDMPGASKKRVLDNLASFVTEQLGGSIEQQRALLRGLVERERLGSTGIGDGIAIPHCRLPGVRRIHGSLIKLEQPIDFDAIDDRPVDLLFALIVPEEKNDEHLATLSAIAQLLQQPDNQEALRNCADALTLFNTAIELERSTQP